MRWPAANGCLRSSMPRSRRGRAGSPSRATWSSRCTPPGWATTPAAPRSSGPAAISSPRRRSARCLRRRSRARSRSCSNRSAPRILEFGAGGGELAGDLLAELARIGCKSKATRSSSPAPSSGAPAGRIAKRAADAAMGVEWLDRLPRKFRGVMIANEVVDAMPVHAARVARGRHLRARRSNGERTACLGGAPCHRRGAGGGAHRSTRARPTRARSPCRSRAWMRSVAGSLEKGALLVIDYGFPAREFYHPQRATGTLMAHYRHHAHGDPFLYPGLQDITTHVDFSALAAQRARRPGWSVLGYATQAQFLVNCGITGSPRPHRCCGRAALRTARRHGAEAALARRDGRALQGALRRAQRRQRSPRWALRAAIVPIPSRPCSERLPSCWSCQVAALAADPPQNTPDAARQRWAGQPARADARAHPAAGLRAGDAAGAEIARRAARSCGIACSATTCRTRRCTTRKSGRAIYDRMVARMEGRGNMGKLMAEMMAGVSAPTARRIQGPDRVPAAERAEAARPGVALPEIHTPAAEAFRLACQQCHVLPDPGRHTAREWPAVVARMQKNMEWMNRVVGSKPGKDEPQLRLADINAFLARHARRTQ